MTPREIRGVLRIIFYPIILVGAIVILPAVLVISFFYSDTWDGFFVEVKTFIRIALKGEASK